MKFSVALVVILAVVTTYSTVSAANPRTAAIGKLLCRVNNNFAPISGVRVKLLDSATLLDDTMGEARSGRDGWFYVSGAAGDDFGTPKPFIKVEYQYNGTYGQMEINGLLKSLRSYSTPVRSYQSFINYKNIVISDDHCRAYIFFHNAMVNYFMRTGETLPFPTLHIRTQAILQLGNPYSERMTINIPANYPLSSTIAKLELAHTIRHYFDGNMLHLVGDAVRFNYARQHTCNTPTNEGLAFEEGWAEFWAGICMESFYGASPYNYTYEGNVAVALRQLKGRCGFKDRDMIDVLRRNRGTIHSFREYELASRCPNYPNTPMPTPASRYTGTTVGPSTVPRRRQGITGYMQSLLKKEDNGIHVDTPTSLPSNSRKRVRPVLHRQYGIIGYLQSLLRKEKKGTKKEDLLEKRLEEALENK